MLSSDASKVFERVIQRPQMDAGEVLSFDWGTTVVGVLDVKTGLYTPYRGTHRIDGAQRIVGCRGRVVSFNGNSCDLPQIATIIGLASAAELKLQGTHDDMWEITGQGAGESNVVPMKRA